MPSPRLAPYVECYWQREEQAGSRHHRVLPDGCVDILFSAGNGTPPDLSVVGLMTHPATVSLAAGTTYFGMRFRPGMAAAFTGHPAPLMDRVEPLEHIWGATAHRAGERLAECRTMEEMAAVAETFLHPTGPPDATQKALLRLSTTNVSLSRVASDSGLSMRTLRRVCLDRAGVSPAYLRRILRFRKAAELARAAAAQRNTKLAQLAVECGYYDQAHFIRDFQEFSGSTPGRFLQSHLVRGPLESRDDEPNKSREPNRLR